MSKEQKALAKKSSELNAAITRITDLYTKSNSNAFEICSIFADIADNNLTEGVYADIFDLGKQVFNLKKVSVYNYIRIGRGYTNKLTAKNSKGAIITKGYRSNLTEEGKQDFGISQIQELFALEKAFGWSAADIKREYIDTECISPAMTTKEIRAFVKARISEFNGETAEGEAVEGEVVESDGSGEDSEEADKVLVTITASGKVTINGKPFTGTASEASEIIGNILLAVMNTEVEADD